MLSKTNINIEKPNLLPAISYNTYFNHILLSSRSNFISKISSATTYNVDGINKQGVQDLFSDILFEASSSSRSGLSSDTKSQQQKEDNLEINNINEGEGPKIITSL